ncbi:hypothetical protein LSH36_662g04037 [Paralvinella palmiformis]|uniref:C-type lectin domain-containing protein n=1 Tax=Paralvinella palmiformis TaxID=53620 RepID=A0AAD9J411_9ANNE|nr:hypothetical protein LSH36_662g04037 [Paralvinella palmiformis]
MISTGTSSGEKITYTRWRSKQPYPETDDANCIITRKAFGWKWADGTCSLRDVYFFCKIY